MNIIKDINNIFSYKRINEKDLDSVLLSTISSLKAGDVDNITKFINNNNICILNDFNLTSKMLNIIKSLKESKNINKDDISEIILSVKQLYNPKTVNLTYNQHCHEILSLISNLIIVNDNIEDSNSSLLDILYQKLLVLQLASDYTKQTLVNNDLARYIPNDKLYLLKNDFISLFSLENINNREDLYENLSKIKNKLNNLSTNIDIKKENNMNNKKTNLNQTDFASDSKESVYDENIVAPDSIEEENQPDKEFSAENELTQEDLNKKQKKTNLSEFDDLIEQRAIKLKKQLEILTQGYLDFISFETEYGREGTICYDDENDKYVVRWDNNDEEEIIYDDIDEIVDSNEFVLIDLSKKLKKGNNIKKRIRNFSKIYSIELDVSYEKSSKEIEELGNRNNCNVNLIKFDGPTGWPLVEYTSTNEENIKNLLKDYTGNDDSEIEFLSEDIQVKNLNKKGNNMRIRNKVNLGSVDEMYRAETEVQYFLDDHWYESFNFDMFADYFKKQYNGDFSLRLKSQVDGWEIELINERDGSTKVLYGTIKEGDHPQHDNTSSDPLIRCLSKKNKKNKKGNNMRKRNKVNLGSIDEMFKIKNEVQKYLDENWYESFDFESYSENFVEENNEDYRLNLLSEDLDSMEWEIELIDDKEGATHVLYGTIKEGEHPRRKKTASERLSSSSEIWLNKKIKKGKNIIRRKNRNLNNSITLDEGQEDQVNEINQVTPELPANMVEESLIEAIDIITVELSAIRKALQLNDLKLEKFTNLSKKEKDLKAREIRLSEIAEELSEVVEDTAEAVEEIEEDKNIETNSEVVESDVEEIESENYEENEENLSRRFKSRRHSHSSSPRQLNRVNGFNRASSVNLSSTKSNSLVSALDKLLKR